MALLLALDQGTTSSRAVVFDQAGAVVASASRPLEARYPRPGWVEQDAEEIWSTQRDAAAEVLDALGDRAGELAAVGIANQRETVVLWDRATGEPVAPAIVWQDRRTTAACERLTADGHRGRDRPTDRAAAGPVLLGDEARVAARRGAGSAGPGGAGALCVGTVDSWVLWKLTGGRVHATDRTNASRTLLMDLDAGAWDADLCDRFGVPAGGAAGDPQRTGDNGFGEIESADRGLETLRGLTVRGILGDQQAALLGQGCLGPGPVKNTYGTGCFTLVHTGAERKPSSHRLLSTAAAGGGFALEGGVFTGGAVVQWLRDQLRLADSTEGIAALAASVPDAGGVVLVPAFAGLGAPHWDPRARGSVQGISAGTTAAHLCRAAVDSIAFQVADLVDALGADLGTPLTELRADGGASANDALMRLQADLLRVPVVRPTQREATAAGAAIAAGVGAGVWPSPRVAVDAWAVEVDTFEPVMPEAEAAAMRGGTATRSSGRGWAGAG